MTGGTRNVRHPRARGYTAGRGPFSACFPLEKHEMSGILAHGDTLQDVVHLQHAFSCVLELPG